MSEQDELLNKLLATFKVKTEEHLQTISSGLVELEKEPTRDEQASIVETVYREVHSLKGAARAVDLTDVERVCQSLESVFAGIQKGGLTASPELFDTLHKTVDSIGALVLTPGEENRVHVPALLEELTNLEKQKGAPCSEAGSEGPCDDDALSPAESSRRGEKAEKKQANALPATHTQPPETKSGDTLRAEAKSLAPSAVRVPAERLDSLFLQTEEMLSAKLAAKRRSAELIEAATVLESWQKEWVRIQPEVRQARRIPERKEGERRRNGMRRTVGKLLDFLEWNCSYIDSLTDNFAGLAQSAAIDARLFDQMVDNLLEDMKQVLMLPFSLLLGGFPKMVRDLSRSAGKEIELVLEGGDVEVDKRILEELKDSLTHLLRNCVDHGVERPDEREVHGKPRRGRITVTVSQVDSSRVEIFVSDDGAGVDISNVKAAAVRTGVVSEKEAAELDEDNSLLLVYQSGVSTSPIITDVSGRGLGLAIVREKTERLGGTISAETRPNVGTSFRILMPLTLSAFRGVLVRANDITFVMPGANVERALRLKREEVQTVEGRETIELNGDVIPLIRLGDVLELPEKRRRNGDSEFVNALVLGAAGTRIAFGVDEVLNEQEVLIKNLGRQLSRVRNISGAMVQSSGKVVPVLNVPDLMKSAAHVAATREIDIGPVEQEPEPAKSVLVVEDSITSRMLLMNILESAGYRVKTAVDGVDAMTTLKTEGFDLVVSDIQMPRMDGFDLTATIRSDEKLSELPLVLVTSLESREHRERGVEVGANAYIAKSSFDQSNLLETIERLI